MKIIFDKFYELVVGEKTERIEILGKSDVEGRLNIRRLAKNITENISELKLVEMIGFGEAASIPDPANDKEEKYYSFKLEDLDDEVLARTMERWAYVKGWLDNGYGKPTGGKLDKIINDVYESNRYKKRPNKKSVKRWIRRAMGMENPTAHSCISRDWDKGNRNSRQPGIIEHVFAEVLKDHYIKQENKDRKSVYTFFKDALLTKWPGVKVPSLRAFYRLFEKVDKRDRIASQEDLIEAIKKTKPKMAGPKAKYPLHVVEIDHSQLNIDLVDIENGVVLRRPWITLVIDRYSRMILGFWIGYETPSAHTVLLALRHAVYPKTYLKEMHPNIVKDWPCYGAPRYLVCDNGRELHSDSVKESLARLNTIVCYCEKLKPWFKGLIESTFKTLSAVMRELPGKTDSNYIKKGRYKSHVRATFTKEHLENYVTQYIVDIYPYKPHTGLRGMPPRVVWDEAMKITQVRAPYNLGHIQGALMLTEWRSLKDRCIHMFSMNYSSENPDFAALLRREYIPDQVKVKYDRSNIGRIWVVDWEDENNHVELTCTTMGDYAMGLPLDVHELILAIARQNAKKYEHLFEEHIRRTRVLMWEQVQQLEAQGDLTHYRLRAFRDYMKQANDNERGVVMTNATIVTPAGQVVIRVPVDAALLAANQNRAPGRQPAQPQASAPSQEPLPPRQPEMSEDDEEAAILARKLKASAGR